MELYVDFEDPEEEFRAKTLLRPTSPASKSVEAEEAEEARRERVT